MRLSKCLIFGILFFFIGIGVAFAQGEDFSGSVTADLEINALEVQWVWAEVVTLDAANRLIVAKYLNYDTDQEEEIILKVDDKTAFENIISFDEIKPKDSLSIDYIVSSEGINIAKNISLDKTKELILPAEETKTESPA